MKLLHVSDWHLGRMAGPESRASDHDAVLAEIIAIARDLKPDLICHSGDLFDRSHPATTDLDRGINALAELAAIAPTAVARGNHDSAALFRVFARLSRPHGLYFVGETTTDPSAVIEIPTALGGTIRLGAVPYQHPHHLVDGRGNSEAWPARYAAAVRDLDAAVGRAMMVGLNPDRDFAVFTAHLHVGGAAWSLGQRRGRLDETYATDASSIPNVTYAAFGHIHQPQELPGGAAPFGRYAGSPLQLDFGEAGEQKSVVYVEAEPHHPARITPIDLTAGRTMRTFRGSLELLTATAGSYGGDILRVIIDSDSHIPALGERLRELLPNSVLIDWANNAADRTVHMVTTETSRRTDEPDLVTMFADYLGSRPTRHAAARDVIDMFTILADAAAADQPPVFPQELALKGIVGCAH